MFPVWPTVLAIAFLGGIVLLAEALSRILISDPEFTRKVVHIGAGNVILLAWHFNLPAWIGISAAAIAAAIALLSYFVPILPSINSVGRQSLGTFFYAVSIGVLISWFFPQQPQYAAIGILTMSWGDGMAALVGQNWGRHRYRIFGSTKSWEGSLTMAIVSYAICCLILLAVEGNLWSSWFIPLVVAVLAAGCEAISKLGIDNLTVPIASGGIPFLLIQLFVAH
ncbi:MAG: phosphatidate cytidylyltransferase [Cyanobacteria bacterium SW_9_44_58]|nr:MAG: phosphatidate cytidylyltransferase [Cyanobacteria bacterium SW_9_44_58]